MKAKRKEERTENLAGLSLPEFPTPMEFRTKSGKLVAKGYSKIARDKDGVVRVYLIDVFLRNLVKVGEDDSVTVGDPNQFGFAVKTITTVQRFQTKDGIEVLCTGSHVEYTAIDSTPKWTAAAGDLYVNGKPVYKEPIAIKGTTIGSGSPRVHR